VDTRRLDNMFWSHDHNVEVILPAPSLSC
jgi:hypothetical protein